MNGLRMIASKLLDKFARERMNAYRRAKRLEKMRAEHTRYQEDLEFERYDYVTKEDPLKIKIREHGEKWQGIKSPIAIKMMIEAEWKAERAAYESRCKAKGVEPEGGYVTC